MFNKVCLNYTKWILKLNHGGGELAMFRKALRLLVGKVRRLSWILRSEGRMASKELFMVILSWTNNFLTAFMFRLREFPISWTIKIAGRGGTSTSQEAICNTFFFLSHTPSVSWSRVIEILPQRCLWNARFASVRKLLSIPFEVPLWTSTP